MTATGLGHRPDFGPLGKSAARAVLHGSRRSIHWPLVIATLAVVTFGVLMVFSAGRGPTGQSGFGVRQALFAVVGFGAMTTVAAIDYRRLLRWWPVVLGGATVALIAVLTPLGTEVRGTQGWFRVGPLAAQPAEFAKLALICGLAVVLHLNLPSGEGAGRPGRPVASGPVTAFGLSVLVLGVAALLVLAEGESGTVLVYCAIALGMLATAGIPVRYLLLLVASGLGAIGLALTANVLAPYQVDRFEAFLDPTLDPLGVGYNQQQAITAIGSGGLTGAGFFDGPQTQLGYLPDQHTDFIFAAIAEELGFVGAATLLLLHTAVLALIFSVGAGCRDRFGRLLCAGVFAMIAFQVIQNVAMNLRLLPITGIPLPFVSYGGSSMVTLLVAIGVVLSVAANQSTPRSGRVARAGA